MVIFYIRYNILRPYHKGHEGGIEMDRKVLKGLLIMIACVVLVVSAVFVYVIHSEHSELLKGFLYGAIGVGLFMITGKILSLIQREGKQDD
jgi:nitric oxide reductase large subunit